MDTTFDEIREILKQVSIAHQENDREIKGLLQSQKEDRLKSEKSKKENDEGFRELREMFKETDVQFQEMKKEFRESKKENEEGFRELRKIFKENDRQFEKSKKENEEGFRELRKMFEETDKQFKETDRRFKETDRKFKETDRLIGGLGEGFGSFTEGLAYPSMRKILYEQYGIDNTVANYLKRFPDGTEIELDAFGHTNGTVNNAVVVEVKTNLKSVHIKKFKTMLSEFKEKFPDFADKKLFGIFCTVGKVSRQLREEVFAAGIHLAIVHDDIFDLKKNENAIDWNHRK